VEIHVITDGKQTVEDVITRILMIHKEADYIHIREKSKTASEIMKIVSALLDKGVPRRKLVINDRLDVALLHHIPNVHLPGHSFSIEKVKEFAPTLRIGCSVHSLDEAMECERAGADYVLFGHVFPTESKAALSPRGVKQLADICQHLQIPVIAIGGIVPDTIPKLNGVKLSGIAVMSYVIGSEDPARAIQNIRKAQAPCSSLYKLEEHRLR
jgi:thiazole tautomerase (transcriptional regulator TenI)